MSAQDQELSRNEKNEKETLKYSGDIISFYYSYITLGMKYISL